MTTQKAGSRFSIDSGYLQILLQRYKKFTVLRIPSSKSFETTCFILSWAATSSGNWMLCFPFSSTMESLMWYEEITISCVKRSKELTCKFTSWYVTALHCPVPLKVMVLESVDNFSEPASVFWLLCVISEGMPVSKLAEVAWFHSGMYWWQVTCGGCQSAHAAAVGMDLSFARNS